MHLYSTNEILVTPLNYYGKSMKMPYGPYYEMPAILKLVNFLNPLKHILHLFPTLWGEVGKILRFYLRYSCVLVAKGV